MVNVDRYLWMGLCGIFYEMPPSSKIYLGIGRWTNMIGKPTRIKSVPWRTSMTLVMGTYRIPRQGRQDPSLPRLGGWKRQSYVESELLQEVSRKAPRL